MTEAIAVFDIGKTNIKLTLVDDQGRELAVRRAANQVRRDGLYPHHDVGRIEAWLVNNLAALARDWHIRAIVPVAHGATAALVDEDALVLPIADYEHDFVLPPHCAPYDAIRPSFDESCSPQLGVGLNLGRQLYAQSQQFPQAFARARTLLMYPQYWAWRLSGVAAAEVSSLGCHTDLWQPGKGDYSSLVQRCGWAGLMPTLRSAWERLGNVRAEIAQATGLPSDCAVLCGVHDSNASLLRYLRATTIGPRVVLSTGTWVIAAALDSRLSHLQEQADMLANVNVEGTAVPCMRFMGGREFAQLAGDAPACDLSALQHLIDAGVMALPCFSGCGGPFAGRTGSILGDLPSHPAARYALATLYCALMTEHCLSLLDCPGDIVVEGSFTANPHFAAVLSALTGRRVFSSPDTSGTTIGGWLLGQWAQAAAVDQLPSLVPSQAAPLQGLAAYRQRWQRIVNQAAVEAQVGADSVLATDECCLPR